MALHLWRLVCGAVTVLEVLILQGNASVLMRQTEALRSHVFTRQKADIDSICSAEEIATHISCLIISSY